MPACAGIFESSKTYLAAGLAAGASFMAGLASDAAGLAADAPAAGAAAWPPAKAVDTAKNEATRVARILRMEVFLWGIVPPVDMEQVVSHQRGVLARVDRPVKDFLSIIFALIIS